MSGVLTVRGRLQHRLAQLAEGARLSALTWRQRLAGGDVRPLHRRPALLAAPVALAAAAGLALALPPMAAAWRWPQLERLHAQALTVALVDARGRFIGIMPDNLTVGRDVPYSTLPPAAVPEGFWRVLKALEDRHLGTWRSIHGIDAPRLVRNALLALAGRPEGGASSLSMQLARALHAMAPDGGTPLLSRKITELIDGMVLHERLGGASSPRFRRWMAAHLPMAVGLSRTAPLGGEIRGIALAARVLWGKRADALSLAEQAVLAAAVKHPAILLPENAPAEAVRKAERRWARIRQRAALGLRLAYGERDPAVREALAELERMPRPRPVARDALVRLIAVDSPARRLQVAANPEIRARVLAGRLLPDLHADLIARFGPAYPAKASHVQITLDMADHIRFRRRVQAALERINRHPRLAVDITRDADVLVAVADGQGRIVRLYQSRPGLLDAAMQPGSVAKMIAALALARRGDAPGARYCRRPLRGNGSRCMGTMSARKAFARSDNPAVWSALARVPESELRQLAETFGFRIHPGTPPRTALTLGLGEITPREVLGMTLALARLARGAGRTQLPAARLWTTTAEEAPVHAAPAIGAGGNGRYLREVLHAPLEREGTLAALPRLAPRVRWLIGKSGTVDSDGGNTRAKWVTAAWQAPDGLRAVVALIASRDSAPLGRRLGALAAPLAAAAAVR